MLPGCAWRVAMPEEVSRPKPVVLTDYGRHTRLALPTGEPGMVEYGFGNWHYYALGERGPVSSFRAIVGIGPATLARRRLPPFEDTDAFFHLVGGRRSVVLMAEEDRIRDLRESLEGTWRENLGPERFHARDDLGFVRYDTTYHLFRNSNHRTADWLERLGCEIRGVPILSNYRVVDGEP